MVVASTRPILELATFALIVAVVSLSFLSLGFIIHFRRKTRVSQHLHSFSSLWTVRLLLVSAASLWSVSQLLPLFGRKPFVCQLHATLSLGLLEPSILLTILFLLNSSTRPPSLSSRVVTAVLFSCLPMLILQTIFVYFSPFDDRLPDLFTRSSYTLQDGTPQSTTCTYPLLSTIVFGSFGTIFWMCFVLSCYNVVTVVINKGLRLRTYAIALGVLVPLPIEVLLLGLSITWKPDSDAHGIAKFGVLVCMLVTVAAAEGTLVIRPILDALDVGGGWGGNSLKDGEEDQGGSTVATGATEEGSEIKLNLND